MTTLRTANRRRRRVLQRDVVAWAYLEWLDRAERLCRAGRLDKMATSGFARRMKRKAKNRKD